MKQNIIVYNGKVNGGMDMLLFYGHPTCSTCKKAEKWLKDRQISYEWKNIKEETPDRELLLATLENEILSRRRLFNTSGNLYKELALKDILDKLTVEEAVDYLVKDGMLIRRPFLTNGQKVTAGFDEDRYSESWA